MKVFRGLSGVVTSRHPTMFIEVDDTNAEAFHVWVAKIDDVVRAKHRRYKSNKNYLIESRSSLGV